MRMRRWLLAALLIAALGAAVPLVREWYLSRSPHLGPLHAVPEEAMLALRVGEDVHFTVAAEGAVGFTWTHWGRPVSFEPTWSFVATPEDAGWQQVTVEVTGRGGLRVARTWDVGVVVPVPPEIEELTPPAGPVALAPGAQTTFRCRAHLPAARPSDHLVFEWTMDDRPLLREEHAAPDAVSELVLPVSQRGAHRVQLRVTEDGRTASLAEWAIDVGSVARIEPATAPFVGPELPTLAAVPPPPTPEPVAPAPAAEPTPPPTLPPPQLVTAPENDRLEARIGDAIVFDARVEPEGAGSVAYRWTIDGKPAARAERGKLEYRAAAPGRHDVAVIASRARREVGRDAWTVEVRAPEPTLPSIAAVPPVPSPRLVPVPGPRRLEGVVGAPLAFETRIEPEVADVSYHWTVDGKRLAGVGDRRVEYRPETTGRHTVVVRVEADRRVVGRDAWVVTVPAPVSETPPPTMARVAPPPPRTVEPTPVVASVEPPVAAAPKSLAEDDVRHWLGDYARAWSRKDIGALRRMGQVRSAAEAAQLERYFQSIDALEVDVRVLTLRVDGERASVEFERTDTVTDPSGHRQQLRLPPIRKEIERTPDGLRFSEGGRHG